MKKIKGTTATGFQFEIDEEARDDFELLEKLSEMSDGDMRAMPAVLVSLLGEDQKKALCEHCRSKSGRVLATKVMSELESIFDSIRVGESDTKN